MPVKLIVCTQLRHAPNPHSCGNRDGREIANRLKREIGQAGLNISIEQSGCMGMCQNGPNIRLLPDGKVWQRVELREVGEIVEFLITRERSIHSTSREK